MNAQTRRYLDEQREKDERAKREHEAMLRRLMRRLGAVDLPHPTALKYKPFANLAEILNCERCHPERFR